MVSVLLTGVPKHVELEGLGSYLHNLFDTDEIGTFRVRELPRNARNKRQVGLDFSSGFDAMAAQEILNGHRYEHESGVTHTLKAKVLPSVKPRSHDFSTPGEFDLALADFIRVSQHIEKSKKKKSKKDISDSESDTPRRRKSKKSHKRKSRKRSRQTKHSDDSDSSRSRSRSAESSVSPKKRSKSESSKSKDKSRQSSKPSPQAGKVFGKRKSSAERSPRSAQRGESSSHRRSQSDAFKEPRASSARPYKRDHYEGREMERGESSSRYHEKGRRDDREYERGGYQRGDSAKYYDKGHYTSRESREPSKYHERGHYDRGYERGDSSSRYAGRGHYSRDEEGEQPPEDEEVTRLNIDITPNKSTHKTKDSDESEEGELSSEEETTNIVIKINPKKTTPKIKQERSSSPRSMREIKIEPDPFDINDWVTIKEEITELEEQVKKNRTISQNPRFVIPIQKVIRQMKRYRTNRISDDMLNKFISVSKAELLIRFRKVMADQTEYMPSAAIFDLYRQHYSREEDAEFVENLIKEFAEGKYESWIDSDEDKENRKRNGKKTKETNNAVTVKKEITDNDNALANENKNDMEIDIKNISIKKEPDEPDELITKLCNEIDMGLSDVITNETSAEQVNTLNTGQNVAVKLNLNEQTVVIKPDPEANTKVQDTEIEKPLITTIKQEPPEFDDTAMLNENENMEVDNVEQNIDVPNNNELEQSIDKSNENVNIDKTSNITEDSILQELNSEVPSDDVKPPVKKECDETIESIEKFVDFITNVNEID